MSNRLSNRLTNRMTDPVEVTKLPPQKFRTHISAVLVMVSASLITGGRFAHAEEHDHPAVVPPVDALCSAAVALALAEPERARSFLSRARLAGWLPELRFRAYRRFARTEGLSFDDPGSGGVVAPVDISAIDDVRYEWRATWDLSRMVFNPEEIQAHSEALRMSDVRRDIQALVIRLYFERRRLVDAVSPADGANGGDARMQRAEKAVRVAEIEAQLDALSGGLLSGWGAARREAAPNP